MIAKEAQQTTLEALVAEAVEAMMEIVNYDLTWEERAEAPILLEALEESFALVRAKLEFWASPRNSIEQKQLILM